YAKSIFELSVADKNTEALYAEMNDLISTIQGSFELVGLLKNPTVSGADKWKVLDHVFKAFSPASKNFIKYVVDKKRESELMAIAVDFVHRYNDMKGTAKATVRSAIPLHDSAIEKVKKYLGGMIGKPEVEIENVIDKSVIGGMVIQYEDKLLDMSVAKELKEIRKHLINNN
ncbi:MAG: F-type H+-transporting ATPase subunit delta, partial [Bacteroidia bacterium]